MKSAGESLLNKR